MIIFESLLTIFVASIIIKAAKELLKIGSSLNQSQHTQVQLVQIYETLSRLCVWHNPCG